MSKPNKKRYKLSEVRVTAEQKRDSSVEFEFGGKEFSFPAPGFWPDEVYEAVKTESTVVMAQALLGDQYEAFRAVGGRADDIALLMEAYAEDQGAELPKS